MTKEELEHEHIREIAENYVNESWGSYLDLDEVDLVMAGIGVGKIIASEQEKRVTELEQKLKIAREIIALGLRVCETSSIEYMNLYQKQAFLAGLGTKGGSVE